MTNQLAFDFDPDPTEDDLDLVDRVRPASPGQSSTTPGVIQPTFRSSVATAAPPAGRLAANLEEVIEAVRARTDLAPSRQRDLISAPRTLARLCHVTPAQLPAAPRELRLRLRDIHPAAVGMSRKRFRNVMADLVQALRIAGHRVNGRRTLVPFTPEWKVLHEVCPNSWRQRRLAPFKHWCSEQGIVPSAVSNEVLDAFMADQDETSLELEAAKLRRTVATNWNKCIKEVPGWPQTALHLVPARIPWTLKWCSFTPAFRDDVDACIERFAATDLDDDDAPDKPLRPTTLKWRRFQIRMAASSLVIAGIPIGEIRSLEDVVRPEPCKMLIKNLRMRYGKKTGNIYGLATSLKSIAQHYCKIGEGELNQLRRICRRNLYKQRGMGQKNRDRLRPFTDPDTRDRLLLLPQELMKEACKSARPNLKSAIVAELAVALEIGEMAPLRMANLAALEIGRSLHFVGSGRGEHAVIALPEQEVKNEIALEYPLPPESTRLIKLYITKFLPLLGPPESMYLFPSPEGGAKQPATLSRRITDAVRDAAGHPFHGHLLRHFAAMIYLQSYPGSYEAVTRILGQATASAALQAYVGLETAAAARHFDEVILRHRRLATQRGECRGRRKPR